MLLYTKEGIFLSGKNGKSAQWLLHCKRSHAKTGHSQFDALSLRRYWQNQKGSTPRQEGRVLPQGRDRQDGQGEGAIHTPIRQRYIDVRRSAGRGYAWDNRPGYRAFRKKRRAKLRNALSPIQSEP